METVMRYRTDDGKEFETAAQAKSHEDGKKWLRLQGLISGDLEAALNGEDNELADAFEAIGKQCAAARIARGGAKRKTTPKTEAAHVDK